MKSVYFLLINISRSFLDLLFLEFFLFLYLTILGKSKISGWLIYKWLVVCPSLTRGVIVSLIECISSKVKLIPCLQDLINSS